MLILGAAEQVDQPLQDRKYRGLPAAALFRKALIGLLDLARNVVKRDPLNIGVGEAREVISDWLDKNATALVQCLYGKSATARCKNQRRVDKAHIPPRIAARKLKTRGKQHTAPFVERLGECGVGWAIVVRVDFPRNPDIPLRTVAFALHGTSSEPH